MNHSSVQKTSLLINGLFSTIILGMLVLVLFFPDTFKWIIETIGQYSKSIGHWNTLILLIISTIESFPVIGVLVPWQQIILIVGGFYGQSHPIFAFGAIAFGAMFGNFIGYIWGIRYGLVFFKKYGQTFALGETELKILKDQILTHGAFSIILGKFHNLTRAFIPAIAGAFQMKKPKFWQYNIIGSVLWAIVMLIIWVVFTSYVDLILDYFWKIVLIGMGGFLLYLWFFKKEALQKYLRDKEAEINTSSSSR